MSLFFRREGERIQNLDKRLFIFMGRAVKCLRCSRTAHCPWNKLRLSLDNIRAVDKI